MSDLTEDEKTVLMAMSGDIGIPAAQISADLAYGHPEERWTPYKVNKMQRSLRQKGYADFGHLTSEEDNSLRGRGYWLCEKGWRMRYGAGQ